MAPRLAVPGLCARRWLGDPVHPGRGWKPLPGVRVGAALLGALAALFQPPSQPWLTPPRPSLSPDMARQPSSPLRGPLSAHPGTAATSLLTHGCICPCSMPRRVRCPDVLERWRSDPRAAWWEDARRTLAASHPVQAATLTEALLTATNAANEPPPERLLQEAAALPPAASVHIGWVVRRLAQHNDGYITAPCQEACLELFGGRAFAANLDRASDAFRRAPPPEPHALAAPPPTLRLQSARKATTPAPTLRMTRTTCGHRRSLATTSFLRPSRSEHALPGPAEALGGVGVGADAILPLPHPLLMRILAPQRPRQVILRPRPAHAVCKPLQLPKLVWGWVSQPLMPLTCRPLAASAFSRCRLLPRASAGACALPCEPGSGLRCIRPAMMMRCVAGSCSASCPGCCSTARRAKPKFLLQSWNGAATSSAQVGGLTCCGRLPPLLPQRRALGQTPLARPRGRAEPLSTLASCPPPDEP